MSFYVVPGGPLTNYLKRATVTCSPAADTSFGLGYLYDDRANVPFRFGTLVGNSYVRADLAVVPDSSFEAGVTSWTAVSGTMDRSNVQAYTGTYSARFVAAGSYLFEFTAGLGEQRQLSAALYGGGGSCASWVRLYCVETGLYLQSGGASWGASADALTQTTAEWVESAVAYTTPSSAELLGDTCTLRIYVGQTNAGTTYRDDVTDLPGVTWSSVHGHNLAPALAPVVQSSPDAGSWTTRITPTLRRDSFYGIGAVAYVRYWRLYLAGTPTAIPWLGEWVLGQYESLNVNPLYPGTLEYDDQQERRATPQGSQHVSLYGGTPQRRLGMAFAFRTDAAAQQWERLHLLSRGGAYPMVIAPVEMDSRVVIMGRLDESAAFTKTDYWSRMAEFSLLEEPLPLME